MSPAQRRTPASRPRRQAVPETDPAISKRIDALVNVIRKKYGPDSIGTLDGEIESVIGTFPTGIASLDEAIGVGGWPLAKVCQISGPPSVGKSALCKKLMAAALAAGVVPYFIDGEQSQDTPERYAALDISTRNVAWTETIFLEDAFAMARDAILHLKRSTDPSIVFLDSLMMPLKAIAKLDMDADSRRAARASFLSEKLGVLVSELKGSKVGLVFVNQIRQRANALPFQDPNYEPGGFALAHWCHLVIRLTPVGRIGRGETAEGVKAKASVRKSKISRPFRTATLGIYFDGRIEQVEDDD